MMVDIYPSSGSAVTPSDSEEVNFTGLYVGTTGDLTVLMASDTSPTTFSNFPVGMFPFRVKKVMSTGTTASDIVGVQ